MTTRHAAEPPPLPAPPKESVWVKIGLLMIPLLWVALAGFLTWNVKANHEQDLQITKHDERLVVLEKATEKTEAQYKDILAKLERVGDRVNDLNVMIREHLASVRQAASGRPSNRVPWTAGVMLTNGHTVFPTNQLRWPTGGVSDRDRDMAYDN